MSQKPAIPKGTRDFLPTDVSKRNYIFDSIKQIFRLYGYAPIETPSFELSSTLLGKYGEEGDRLIFRILNSGEKMKKADIEALQNDNLPRFANSLAEKALRYDLTVPFARFVVQHQNELSFPFKRYQIQPVWRADRPQHGRYQEFYQCDVDVVGSDSLLYEVELVQIFDAVLTKLNLPGFTIKINNRKILSGIAEVSGEADRMNSIDRLSLERGLLEFDVTLARGLNYYTGAIFEVKAHEVKMGSICGGGRYDDLTGLFGMKGLSGVGISFGADRIYDVLNELNLFPEEVTSGLTLLFINFGDKEVSKCLELASNLRKSGIDCEIYPSASKLQKQMKYANDRGVKYVALLGENELANQKIILKDMDSGEQRTISFDEIIKQFKK